MELKQYKQLPVPSDSAWERKSLRRYLPIWLKVIIEGITNILRWIPIIYRDRQWDDNYIFEILKFKLIQQRKELVGANRHEGVESINRDITTCLNLIERVQNDYYSLEYMDYCENKYNWNKCEDKPGYSELDIVPIWENYDDYFKKYKSAVKRVLVKNRNLSSNKERLAMELANYNQMRCQALLFKILNEKINHWWD